MSVFSRIGVQFLCAAGTSHLWKDQGVASDIGHCSDCVVHGCAKKISVLLGKYKACCRRSSSKALCIWITLYKHAYWHVVCKSHSYCMSFAHLRKTHAHLHFFANQHLCCDMLQLVCVRHIRINFCVVTCSSLLCVCVFETCLHVFLLVSDIIGASCGHWLSNAVPVSDYLV